MTDFVEVRLELGFDYGAQGGRSFLTTGPTLQNGVRRRNQQWQDPLGTWSIGSRTVDQAFLDYLLGFHAARRGALVGFRFRDWQDYRLEFEPLAVDGGATTQLIKTYSPGSNPYVRRIIKPDDVALYDFDAAVEGVLLTPTTDYTLDTTTGLITWAAFDPEPGADVRALGTFDVPVTFDRDVIDSQFLAYEDRGAEGVQAVHAVSPLFVRELREVEL